MDWPLSLRRRVRASLLVAAGVTCIVAAALVTMGVHSLYRPPPYPRFTATLLDLRLGPDRWLEVQANEHETCAHLWPPRYQDGGHPIVDFTGAMVCRSR